MELAPRDELRRGEARDDDDCVASKAGGLVIFANKEARLSVERDERNSLALVSRVHGEEVAAYELDRD
jgi:shikimate kinase